MMFPKLGWHTSAVFDPQREVFCPVWPCNGSCKLRSVIKSMESHDGLCDASGEITSLAVVHEDAEPGETHIH